MEIDKIFKTSYTEVKHCEDLIYFDFDPNKSIYINLYDFENLTKSYINKKSIYLIDWLDWLELSPAKAFIDYDLHSQDSDTVGELLKYLYIDEYDGIHTTSEQIGEICDIWGVEDFSEIPYWHIIDTIYNECDDVEACGWLNFIKINANEVARRLAFKWCDDVAFFRNVTGFKPVQIEAYKYSDGIAVEFDTVEDLLNFCKKFAFKIK